MAHFKIRTDSVDVEQIMHRIRTRIREKRGVDYTDDEIRELAAVKLERFLDPKAVRSDLIEQYQRRRPTVPFENYEFDDDTIYKSSRSITGRLLAMTRRLLNPVLKLFFNPGPIIQVLHHQSDINVKLARQHEQVDALNFEIMNNIVVELTRLGIEVKNLKMQLESMSSRLDFDERRAKALEGAVQYRPEARLAPSAGPRETPESAEGDTGATATKPRRRRRRGRRRSGTGGDPAAPTDGATARAPAAEPTEAAGGDAAGTSGPADTTSVATTVATGRPSTEEAPAGASGAGDSLATPEPTVGDRAVPTVPSAGAGPNGQGPGPDPIAAPDRPEVATATDAAEPPHSPARPDVDSDSGQTEL